MKRYTYEESLCKLREQRGDLAYKRKEIVMDKSTLFAAKSNKEGLWECVPQHLQDTANVMKCLCDTETGWVSRSFIEAAGMDASSFTNVCVFIAATHDIAKLTPVFQNKISSSLPGLRERLLSKGFDIELD